MRTLHLARGRNLPRVLGPSDWVVELSAEQLVLGAHGTPPVEPGRIDHDQLVALVFAADRVITW